MWAPTTLELTAGGKAPDHMAGSRGAASQRTRGRMRLPSPLWSQRRHLCAPNPRSSSPLPALPGTDVSPPCNAAQTTVGYWKPQRRLPGYSNSQDMSGGSPPGAPTSLTFIRSYLSSTSCNQEMNCRALKRSLTDLFSSPWAKDSSRNDTVGYFTFTLSTLGSNRPHPNPSEGGETRTVPAGREDGTRCPPLLLQPQTEMPRPALPVCHRSGRASLPLSGSSSHPGWRRLCCRTTDTAGKC